MVDNDAFADVENILSILFSNLDIEVDSSSMPLRNAKVEERDEDGRTPLHHAAMLTRNSLDETRTLINRGADIAAEDSSGNTPIHYAATSENWDTCEFLLLKRAKVKNDISPNKIIHKVLKKALKNDFIRNRDYKKIQCKINWPIFSVYDHEYGGVSTRNTILHLAIRCGDYECIEFLCQNGADLKACNSKNITALHLLLAYDSGCNREDLMKAFEGSINTCDYQGKTPLYLAIEKELQDTVSFLLENGADVNVQDKRGMSPLHYSVILETDAISKLLLQKDVNINCQNWKGETPLYCATKSGSVANIKFLLENGADVNIPNEHGHTVLFLNIMNDDIESVSRLIQKGAKINIKDCKEKVPIHYAINHASTDMVNLLLEANADLSSVDKQGTSLLKLALMGHKNDAIILLIEKMKENYIKIVDDPEELLNLSLSGCSDEVVGMFIEEAAPIMNIIPAIQAARSLGRENLIPLMEEKGAEEDIKSDSSSDGPDHFLLKSACRKRKRALPELITWVSSVTDNTTIRDDKGNTPLHLACAKGRRSLVRYLALHGNKQCLFMENDENLKPLQIALTCHRTSLEKYLNVTNGDFS